MSELLRLLGFEGPEVSRVLDTLAVRGRTVATAESLTGGLLCAVLTSVSGASAVVRGGMIVYATELKSSMAGVSAELLAEHGAVHPAVAEQLASGAAEACRADYGVGLTGVAGPDPQDGVAPGTVYLAVAGPTGRAAWEHHVDGDREAVRAGAARSAIGRLASTLDSEAEGTNARG